MKSDSQCVAMAMALTALTTTGCSVKHSHFRTVRKQPEKITINGEPVDPTYATYVQVFNKTPDCCHELDAGRICIWNDAWSLAGDDHRRRYDMIIGFDDQGMFKSPDDFPSIDPAAGLRKALDQSLAWFGNGRDCPLCQENLCETQH